MNIDDRIIEMLTSMQAGINGRLDKIETGQANLTTIMDSLDAKVMRLEAKVNDLKAGQTELKATQAEIISEAKAIRGQTEHLTEFEAEIRLNLKSLRGILKVNTFDIAELKAAVNV